MLIAFRLRIKRPATGFRRRSFLFGATALFVAFVLPSAIPQSAARPFDPTPSRAAAFRAASALRAPMPAAARQVDRLIAQAEVITADELKAQTFQNAWQAVISLRPSWPQVPAYVRYGRVAFERLQEVRIEDVKEIRMLSREQARVRFGPDAQQTILVVTK